VPVCSPNPGEGVTNFDTFMWALINVFVVTTMANWTDIMTPLWYDFPVVTPIARAPVST
jgi:hypothetical protein